MVDLTANSEMSLGGRSHAASDALGLWEPKRTLTLSAARAHTRRIALLRRVLVGASVILLSVLVIYFATQSREMVIEDDPDTSVRMIGPRYSGRTSDNLPFELTSDTATRELENRTEVDLDKPVLQFQRAAEADPSFVNADLGRYDDVEKILELRSDLSLPEDSREDVVLDTDDGYRCVTSHARIFLREKRIIGDAPISCTGNFGTVNGNTYEILDDYRTFIFKDGMDGIINRDADTPTGLRAAPDAADASTAEAPRPVFGFDGDGPIDVKANRAVYYGGTTDLFGNVVVDQDDSIIYSDEMKILRDRAGPRATGTIRLGTVREIISTGNFRYLSTDNDVRGDKGVYLRDNSTMTVTGDVTVVQPSGDTVSTDSLVYDTVTETIRFSGQCRGRACGDNERTRVTFGN